jgi:hypothetical protein
MQQFSSLLSWRLFTAQYVSGVFPPVIKSSMTAGQPLVLPSYRGDSRAVFVVGPAVRPARPRTHHETRAEDGNFGRG